MAPERSTKTLNTTNGHQAVMYDYVTGNEAREIKRVSEENGGGPEALEKAQDFALKLIVLELNGNPDDLVARIGNLQLIDYSEIVAAVTDLLNPKKKSQA
jgi:hypothetical protein